MRYIHIEKLSIIFTWHLTLPQVHHCPDSLDVRNVYKKFSIKISLVMHETKKRTKQNQEQHFPTLFGKRNNSAIRDSKT